MNIMHALAGLANRPATRYSLLVPLVYMAMIFGLSSIPGIPPVHEDVHWQHRLLTVLTNSIHVPLFAGLAWSWRWSLTAIMDNTRRMISLTFVLTLAYGIFDEWHQGFTPYRTPSLTDIMLDATGALLAVWLFSRCRLAKDVATPIHYRSS